MKKFLLKVLLFSALVVVMDFTFGFVFSWLRTHAKGGSTANCEYIANRCEDDIIILGSSRASHHYVPQIIEDSLGMSCYNCGEEGNGVVLAYGRLKMLTNRYKPKLVLFEITPEFDYGTSEANSKYLGYLRAYYDKEGISDIFKNFDGELSWLKMKSKMYQNTGRLLPDIADNLFFRNNLKGYSPLYGTIKTVTEKQRVGSNTITEIDSLKFSYLQKIIELSKNKDFPLVFIISPHYGTKDGEGYYEPAFLLCKKYNIPVHNYINHPYIASNQLYFQDEGHMNDKGAAAYTNIIIDSVLIKYFQIKKK